MTADPAAESQYEAAQALSECLFAQYRGTVLGLTAGLTYALYFKAPQAMGVTIVAGMAGTVADGVYGWFGPCQQHVQAWQQQTKPQVDNQNQKDK